MQIKVVKAPSMKEAMEQVKEELGRDAVILHTKKYREGGFMGYNGKEVVEVTAAIEDTPDDNQLKNRAKRSVNAEHDQQSPMGNTLDVVSKAAPLPNTILSQYKTNGTETGVRMAEAPITAPPLMNSQTGRVLTTETIEEATQANVATTKEDEEVTPVNDAQPVVQPVMIASNPEDAEKIQKLEAELEEMEESAKAMAEGSANVEVESTEQTKEENNESEE